MTEILLSGLFNRNSNKQIIFLLSCLSCKNRHCNDTRNLIVCSERNIGLPPILPHLYDAQHGKKGTYRVRGQRMPRSTCAFAQSDQNLRCAVTESLETIDCIGEQRRPWSDCAHAQSDQGLRCFVYGLKSLFSPCVSYEPVARKRQFRLPPNQYFSAHSRPISKATCQSSLAEISRWPTSYVSEQHRFWLAWIITVFANVLMALFPCLGLNVFRIFLQV